MSYKGISIQEAIENIKKGEWVLPAIQRPYVWGNRYESEIYICKLFDSLLREYPIGSIILWKTDTEVPFREFIDHYDDSQNSRPIEDEGKWKNTKALVYDGQQRLQTLYSCLKYTFNNKVLVFDLLWVLSDEDPDVGFRFENRTKSFSWNYIRINELFGKNPNDYILYETQLLKDTKISYPELTEEQNILLRVNLNKLWRIFVTRDKESISYFSIPSNSDTEVNEIFQRLNTGGVPLSQADLLFSRIKKNSPEFEENLQKVSKEIQAKTSSFEFDAYQMLQLIFLIVKGGVRLESGRVKDAELQEFIDTWDTLIKPLESCFIEFLLEQFKINHSAIIPSKLALLPILIYFYEAHKKGFSFKKDINKDNQLKIMKYFIKSQINSWDLQSAIDKFTQIIKDNFNSEKQLPDFSLDKVNGANQLPDFPLDEIEDYVRKKTNRKVELYENSFENRRLFALKIICFRSLYNFSNSAGRFNPEIDHIFPKKLKGREDDFSLRVDVLWNLQPVSGHINGHKTNHHPKDFFEDKLNDATGSLIKGSRYIGEYEFVPDLSSEDWSNPFLFIENRRNKMIKQFNERYGIQILSNEISEKSQ